MTQPQIDQGAWALALTLQVLGLAADPAQIVHEAGLVSALSESDLLRAAGRYPVKAKAVTSAIKRLSTTPFPAIAMMNDGGMIVIGKIAEEGVLCQSSKDQRPIIIPMPEFEKQW